MRGRSVFGGCGSMSGRSSGGSSGGSFTGSLLGCGSGCGRSLPGSAGLGVGGVIGSLPILGNAWP
jgi:hypothetical protein